SDVVNDYGNHGLVEIADTPEDFVVKAERLLSSQAGAEWLSAVDKHLAGMSWDETWSRMMAIIAEALKSKTLFKNKNTSACLTT
ncbi:MAG TPA: glycosyltransferase family 1 protein, partial [Chryseosolibacter sp.]|nr:glycosyltransferase family 1 protein [Chryseosolibacter sp.]